MKTTGRIGIVMTALLSLLLVTGCSDDDDSDTNDTLTLAPGVTMKLVLIPSGTFTMGSPETEKYRSDDEGPQRQVTMSSPFYMGVTEVTRGQFAAFVADSGYKTTAEKEGWAYAYDGRNWGKVTGASWRKVGFQQTDTHPVVCVSWDDATAFCTWLKGKTGRSVQLPTESQWEYACRAGTTTRFSFGDSDDDLHKHANYCDRSCTLDLPWKDKDHDDGYGFTSPAGSYKANAWGLYDMHGNVWEWCADWYADSYANADTRDPKGPAHGSARVLRGGSWNDIPQGCRAAVRGGDSPGGRLYFGFRVVVVSGLGVD